MSTHSRPWLGLLWRLLSLWILAVSWCRTASGQIPSADPPAARNFLQEDDQLRAAAEAARVRSAQFWSGRPLPGDWYAPCPILWESRRGAGSGRTRFRLDRGEVYGWEMHVSGSREAVLADVLPHEVDHAVRASLVRRPLPRWLDEGCSTLFESETLHAQLRSQRREDPRTLTLEDLDRMEYPADPADNQALYAAGFSLVEYLLSDRGTPAELLEVQRSPEPPSRSLATVYRQPVPELLKEWQQWEAQRLELGIHCGIGCPCHRPPLGIPEEKVRAADLRPELHVWTSATCRPCQQFYSDLSGPLSELTERYQVILHDFHRERAQAARDRIDRVPTFLTRDRRIVEYHGPEPLLMSLGLRSPPVETGPPESPSPPRIQIDPGPPTEIPVNSGPPEDPVQPPERPLVASPAPPQTLGPVAAPGVFEGDRSRWLAWGLSGWQLGLAIAAAAGTGGLLTPAVIGPALRFAGRTMDGLRGRRSRTAATPPSITSPIPMAPSPAATSPGAEVRVALPFPRVLDEARELLALRQCEGRVAALDAIRGMALDDAAQVILDSDKTPEAERAAIRRLLTRIDQQVDEIAPISTQSRRTP